MIHNHVIFSESASNDHKNGNLTLIKHILHRDPYGNGGNMRSAFENYS